jgi:hypothetical protein
LIARKRHNARPFSSVPVANLAPLFDECVDVVTLPHMGVRLVQAYNARLN